MEDPLTTTAFPGNNFQQHSLKSDCFHIVVTLPYYILHPVYIALLMSSLSTQGYVTGMKVFFITVG